MLLLPLFVPISTTGSGVTITEVRRGVAAFPFSQHKLAANVSGRDLRLI